MREGGEREEIEGERRRGESKRGGKRDRHANRSSEGE